jgi:hypothetical protein
MSGKRVLLVEGKDDEHVVKNICGRLGLGQIDNIRPQTGKNPLLETLPVHLQESDITVLGIILDADTDLAARWRAVSDRLTDMGYQGIGALPDKGGTILMPPSGPNLLPKVGVWLMPNNSISGILEDFLQFLVPEGDPLFLNAQQVIAALPEQRFSDVNKPKALMHTWLAWQKEPGKPYGQAITARYLDADLPLAQTFAAWLQKTFFE